MHPWIKTLKAFVKELCGSRFFSTKSYSQEGEDLILRNLFWGITDGFYVEVGCHHPFRFSNTFMLYKMNWNGICIDPLPGTALAFKKWRPRDICIECGISATPSTLRYFMFNDPALNTFDPILAQNHIDKKNDFKLIDTKEIRTFPLNEVIERHLINKSQKINLLAIDAEGFDLQVLESNDWAQFRPEVIVAECLYTSLSELHEDPLVQFLIQKNYIFHSKTGNSVIFRDASLS